MNYNMLLVINTQALVTSYSSTLHDRHRVFAKENRINKNRFCILLEQGMITELQQYIERRRNQLVASTATQDPYYKLYEECGIKIDDIYESFRLFTELDKYEILIDDIVPQDTYDLWTFSKIKNLSVLQNLGDIRIMEWNETFIKKGKYVGRYK